MTYTPTRPAGPTEALDPVQQSYARRYWIVRATLLALIVVCIIVVRALSSQVPT